MFDLDEEMERMQKMLDRRERMALGVTCTEMIELITRLREAEKDAARYRWLVYNSVFGMKQNGASFSLSFDCPAPEHSGRIGECIDQAMKEKGDE